MTVRPDVTHPLVALRARQAAGVTLRDFAAAAGIHPDLVRRYVALGLLAPDTDAAGTMRFGSVHPVRIARIHRLRTGLGLNYAAMGVVLDLLDRIEELETALARRGSPGRR